MTPASADRADSADRRFRARAVLNALLAHYGRSANHELIDALFVGASDGTGWLTGISEVSVSFRSDAVAVRALSEVVQQRRLDGALAATGLEWGITLLRRLSSATSRSYAAPLFAQIYDLIYRSEIAEPAPWFRFGAAIEVGAASPVLKLYFDLRAPRVEHRRTALERIAAMTGDASGFDAWKRACPGIDAEDSRVIGVDFAADDAVRTKFYWGARDLTWDDLVATSREISGELHVDTLRRLRSEVCPASNALSSTLVSMCTADGDRSLKLDICLARLYESDADARQAIERFRGAATDRNAPFTIISGGLDPRRTKRIHQYLGVELPPRQSSRATIYYRPIGLETEHLSPSLRPQVFAS